MSTTPRNILITGASGYLGGSLLSLIPNSGLPSFGKLYALVRKDEHAARVGDHGAEPIRFDIGDEAAVREAVIEKQISIVFFLVDAMRATSQVYFIKALAELKRDTGIDVHFLHTTGAKIFSSHAGAPTDRPLFDDEPGLYEIQKAQKAPVTVIQTAVETNNTIIERAEELGVQAYIFAPCIVYGQGTGFGNKISIQTVAIVKAAKACRRVHRVDSNNPTWPVCHISDTTTLYVQLLRRILEGSEWDPAPSGKRGYYLAASGSVAWNDLYSAMATQLHQAGVVDTAEVTPATTSDLEQMAKGLGCPKELVPLQLGGLCTFTAKNAKHHLRWDPLYSPEDILSFAGKEVDLILANL